MKKVIIVGGGIGGLATANLLAKAGYKVEVYEKNAWLGGRAGRMDKEGFRFDTGPSWYLMPEVFEHYYSLLDTSVKEQINLIKLKPSYKVFFENKPSVVITSDLDKDAKTFENIEEGSGERLRQYAKKGIYLYDLSLKYFLYTNFERLRDLLQPRVLRHLPGVMRFAFTSIHSYVKSFFKDQRLQQIVEYPMVFLGTSPFKAPALYSLMSALDFKQGVFYPQGGMYTIIESLVAIGNNLGVKYHVKKPVDAIVTQDGIATGVMCKKKTISADIVIANADIHFVETELLEYQDRSYPASYWQRKDPGISCMLLYLGVEGKVPELEHHSLLFVDEWKKNFDDIYHKKSIPEKASIYICKPSELDETTAPKGKENLFVLVPMPTDFKLDKKQSEKLADRYLAQIEHMTGVDDLRERIVTQTIFKPEQFNDVFNSWQSTALGASHILFQSALFRTPNKSKKVKNLYYVGGNTVPGIGLPMCLIGAELVYKRIAGIRRGGQETSIRELV